ncbi:phospholipase D family protein [Aliagarivorans taiwanensis]|uniref:phospholipase D family protein n=1 Tax=Aliagarivorans taiwanensis TaxID=561966 RepID=UPI0003FC222D|nr:phospholipase D family protein [Aliagarivorans taiwanensis]
MSLVRRIFACMLTLAVSFQLFSCAQRPEQSHIDALKHPSEAILLDPASTLAEAASEHAMLLTGSNGVTLLSSGISAFAARWELIEHAEVSVDAQYYRLNNDLTGKLFLVALLRAAERGVRVRLLVDDISTSGFDQLLNTLAAHPNLSVRVYNPFYDRRYRGSQFVHSFSRLNHRMHNKSLTVDGAFSIVGGRNIGDEYFSARHDMEFSDLDAIVFGPVVADIQQSFDEYWNHHIAYPIEALANPPADTHKVLLELEQQLYAQSLRPYLQATQRFEDYFSQQGSELTLFGCEATLLSDTPGVLVGSQVATKLGLSMVRSAESIVVASPYFVPRKHGAEGLADLAEKGIEISILTNSLASTDVVAVHSGYQRYRKQLLEAGVNLFELKADAPQDKRVKFFGNQAQRSSLHSKVFVFDQTQVFIGSFNWDPRSININSEMGLLFDCPELASFVYQGAFSDLKQDVYFVELEGKRVRWREYQGNGEVRQYRSEPNASWWRRFQVWVASWLPIEDQL